MQGKGPKQNSLGRSNTFDSFTDSASFSVTPHNLDPGATATTNLLPPCTAPFQKPEPPKPPPPVGMTTIPSCANVIDAITQVTQACHLPGISETEGYVEDSQVAVFCKNHEVRPGANLGSEESPSGPMASSSTISPEQHNNKQPCQKQANTPHATKPNPIRSRCPPSLSYLPKQITGGLPFPFAKG